MLIHSIFVNPYTGSTGQFGKDDGYNVDIVTVHKIRRMAMLE